VNLLSCNGVVDCSSEWGINASAELFNSEKKLRLKLENVKGDTFLFMLVGIFVGF